MKNKLYNLLTGTLIAAIGGCLSLLIYDYVSEPRHPNESKLEYTYTVRKAPVQYNGRILNRNSLVYWVNVYNLGVDLYDSTPASISFRNADAKIFYITLCDIAVKSKEKDLRTTIGYPMQAYHPYIPELTLLFKPEYTDIMKEGAGKFSEIIERTLSKLSYDTLPQEACKLDIHIPPMEHGDIGEFVVQVFVQNIDVFRKDPPVLDMVSKKAGVKIIEEEYIYDFLDRIISVYFSPHLRFISILFLLSIAVNILLALFLLRLKTPRRKV
jgi:hypothetical protein